MARGRVPGPVQEHARDDVRCTRTGSNGWRCLERRSPGSAMCERHYLLLSRPRPKPLPNCPPKPRLKPLNCYNRRKRLQFRPGGARDLQSNPHSSPLPQGAFVSVPRIEDAIGNANVSSRGRMVNSPNQNSSSVVEDPSIGPVNTTTTEGTPLSEPSVSAPLNCNPNPSSNGFQKTRSIWQAVETLEVFSRVPQRPHFMKLQSFCEEMREGIALGLMVTYANLTDSIKNLSFDDDVAVFMEKIACLNPLEENGFDVDRFRARLQQLVQIKTGYVGSGSRLARLERQLAGKEVNLASLERVQLETEKISREINGVKERVNKLVVERDRLLDQTVGNGHEITRLKEAISDLNRLNESTREEFASLSAEPI